MALPDFIKNEVGTSITWLSSGGTYAITMTSVISTNGRQGAKGDLGANRARIYDVLFTSSVTSAATAGLTIDLYWSASNSATAGTNNSGGTSGTDATFNTVNTEYAAQLIFIGSLVLTGTSGAGTGVQRQWLSFCPPCRYGMPVIINNSGQTLGGTAGDHTITLVPREEGVEDTV